MSEIRLYNTLTRSVETLQTATPGKVGMYVCGMTVYDYCHIGHARAMISFDLIFRWLRERGYEVNYVRNHTDVDDKIIRRALEIGEDPLALSERFIGALDDDLDRLGILQPTHAPKVSQTIDGIVEMIATLIEKGHAYALGADVYYAVESFADYGKLSGKRLADLRAGERVEVDTTKRHPGDFALWKGAKPSEPAWDAPWGAGRPGWHIECSAMARHYLGDTFEIHGGGIDLVFPHHENEIAQSEGATGHAPLARYWLHNGHLTLESGKMSKSLGNVMRIRDILDQVPAEALRMLYMGSHYRSPLPYAEERLIEALGALDRLYLAKETLEAMAASATDEPVERVVADLGAPAQDLAAAAAGFDERFAAAMDDDFNSARALALLYELARAANRFGNNPKWRKRGGSMARQALAAYALSARVLGIGGMQPDAWFNEVKTKRLAASGNDATAIEARIQARADARAGRDWAASDRLRDELAALGVVLMDGPTGTTWRMGFPDDAPT
jgi:cysteinyl-tRNA synthetase